MNAYLTLPIVHNIFLTAAVLVITAVAIAALVAFYEEIVTYRKRRRKAIAKFDADMQAQRDRPVSVRLRADTSRYTKGMTDAQKSIEDLGWGLGGDDV